MVSIKNHGILLNIIDHCLRIETTLVNVNKGEFHQNKDIQDIVCFNTLQIGELAKHLSSDFISQYADEPWDDIKGLRDIIVHGYDTIDWDRLWNTATIDIKKLREYCEKTLRENK